jgi:AcrR family transcriptional regulator
VDPDGGLRERKKRATRQALHRAAVLLATRLGPHKVTVEAVADAADVSRRTFSNYFANKEEALLYSHADNLARVIAMVERRPSDEPAWTALTRATEEFTSGLDREQDWYAALRLLQGNPTLLSRQVATYAAAEGALASLLADRLPLGPDLVLRSHILAAAYLGTVCTATQAWLEQTDVSLAELVSRSLRIAGDRFD